LHKTTSNTAVFDVVLWIYSTLYNYC